VWLISAPRGRIFLRAFDELSELNFTIVTAVTPEGILFASTRPAFKETRAFKHITFPLYRYFASLATEFAQWLTRAEAKGQYQDAIVNSGWDPRRMPRDSVRRMKSRSRNISAMLSKLTVPSDWPAVSVEEMTAQCGRVAYVESDFRSRIQNFKVPEWRVGTLDSRPFMLSEEEIFRSDLFWQFQLFEGFDEFVRVFADGVAAGLFSWFGDRLDSWKFRDSIGFFNRTEARPKALEIGTNFFQGFFWILGMITAVSVSVFVVESGCGWAASSLRVSTLQRNVRARVTPNQVLTFWFQESMGKFLRAVPCPKCNELDEHYVY
jgi:hypothetical protein